MVPIAILENGVSQPPSVMPRQRNRWGGVKQFRTDQRLGICDCVLSAKRWFKLLNQHSYVRRIQRSYRRSAAKRWFKSGQTILQVTEV